MDQPKIIRLLDIMKYLVGPTYYSIDEMAKRINTSSRTIYRYIDSLKEAGFAVDMSRKTYPRLLKESKFFKDISSLVFFTDEEALIFNQLLDGLNETNALKRSIRNKLSTIYNHHSQVKCTIHNRNTQNIRILNEAIEEHKQVKLKGYSSSNSKNIRDRIIEPIKFTPDYVQICCFDTEDKKTKLFNISRIDTAECLKNNWKYEQEHNPGHIDIFRTMGYEPMHVKLRLSLLAYNLIIEEYPLSVNDLYKDDDNHWILDAHINFIEGLGRFVMGLLEEIEILDSPKFKKFIIDKLQKEIKRLKE